MAHLGPKRSYSFYAGFAGQFVGQPFQNPRLIPESEAESDDPIWVEQAWEWLRLFPQDLRPGLWYWDEVRQKLRWDANCREMFGVRPDFEVTLQAFIDALHPDDRDQVMNCWRSALENKRIYVADFRAVRPDGTVRWIHGRGKGHYDRSGRPLSMLGVALDITDQKEGERERPDLSGRLIEAQEQERTRLARELHDDFSQRMALLAFDLETASEMFSDSPDQALKRLGELRGVAVEIGEELHALSHRLHSSTLDVLGLEKGVDALCAEFAKRNAIKVDLNCEELPKSIPPDLALCVFRILQEALRNVSKHSRATQVAVKLHGTSEKISLNIADNGVGFTSSSTAQGIGIRSMRERVRMFSGHFDIQSRPNGGTKIAVEVPLRNDRATQAAASSGKAG